MKAVTCSCFVTDWSALTDAAASSACFSSVLIFSIDVSELVVNFMNWAGGGGGQVGRGEELIAMVVKKGLHSANGIGANNDAPAQ